MWAFTVNRALPHTLLHGKLTSRLDRDDPVCLKLRGVRRRRSHCHTYGGQAGTWVFWQFPHLICKTSDPCSMLLHVRHLWPFADRMNGLQTLEKNSLNICASFYSHPKSRTIVIILSISFLHTEVYNLQGTLISMSFEPQPSSPDRKDRHYNPVLA